MSDALQTSFDRELLSLARAVLEGASYSVEHIESPISILLAENRYFFVGVVATSTIGQLLLAEDSAEAFLAERLSKSDPGPKLWDAYLILLTQERSPEDDVVTRQLFSINYDTVGMRRIAHSGVEPTLASVRNALTPFVPPIQLDDPTVTANPFLALVESLAERGIEREVAIRAIEAFRQGVNLGDVL